MDNWWGYLLVFATCLLSYRVYEIGEVLRTAHDERVRVRTEMVLKQEKRKCRLPCVCRRYYDSGTDEWMDCMLVGRK